MHAINSVWGFELGLYLEYLHIKVKSIPCLDLDSNLMVLTIELDCRLPFTRGNIREISMHAYGNNVPLRTSGCYRVDEYTDFHWGYEKSGIYNINSHALCTSQLGRHEVNTQATSAAVLFFGKNGTPKFWETSVDSCVFQPSSREMSHTSIESPPSKDSNKALLIFLSGHYSTGQQVGRKKNLNF